MWVCMATQTLTPMAAAIPHAIREFMTADPTSDLAQRWRRFVKHSMLPNLQWMAELLQKHGSIIELPEKAWLLEKYPNEVGYTNQPCCMLLVDTLPHGPETISTVIVSVVSALMAGMVRGHRELLHSSFLLHG